MRVQDHSFTDPKVQQAIPYGVYDLTADTGWVNVGTDHDTSAFAVAPSAAGGRSGAEATTRRPPGC